MTKTYQPGAPGSSVSKASDHRIRSPRLETRAGHLLVGSGVASHLISLSEGPCAGSDHTIRKVVSLTLRGQRPYYSQSGVLDPARAATILFAKWCPWPCAGSDHTIRKRGVLDPARAATILLAKWCPWPCAGSDHNTRKVVSLNFPEKGAIY